jgi:shikimate kinase
MVARCVAQPNAAERPVLADRERLTTRLAARLPYYRQAHLTVATPDLTPEEVVDLILDSLREEEMRRRASAPVVNPLKG